MSSIAPGRGRKAADAMAARGIVDNQQAIWQAICVLDEFSQKDIQHEVYHQQGKPVHHDTIRSYVKRLCLAGFLEVIREEPVFGNARRKIYQRTAEAPVETPRVTREGKPSAPEGSANENMWRTMRILGQFTARDLAIHASTEETIVSEGTAKAYTKMLFKAGYLVLAQAGKTPKTQHLYRFLPSRYSGPRAPMIQKIKAVFDPNLNKRVWPEELTHEH